MLHTVDLTLTLISKIELPHKKNVMWDDQYSMNGQEITNEYSGHFQVLSRFLKSSNSAESCNIYNVTVVTLNVTVVTYNVTVVTYNVTTVRGGYGVS